ncbi:hypothetical protein GGF32_000928 [Allomyces javanicus]|nr:hypothetical protein GGF32_000928 [Allomyces javanicus]
MGRRCRNCKYSSSSEDEDESASDYSSDGDDDARTNDSDEKSRDKLTTSYPPTPTMLWMKQTPRTKTRRSSRCPSSDSPGRGHVSPFIVSGSATLLPAHPGLIVDGVGTVSLPIVEPAQVAELVAVSRDPNRSSAWEIDASKVKLTNWEWHGAIKAMTKRTVASLGYAKVRATMHLDKLQLCGPVDQQGVALDGGESAAGDRQSAKFGGAPMTKSLSLEQWDKTSAFGAHYAVVYRGAEHKFEPIKSGYRFVLVYSLCWPEGKPGMPRIMRGIKARIAEELASCRVRANVLLPAKDRFTFFFAEGCCTARFLNEGKGDDESSQTASAPEIAITHWFCSNGRHMLKVKPKIAQATSLDITVMAGILNPERKSLVKDKKTILVAVPRSSRVQFAKEHLDLTIAHDLLLEDLRNDHAWFDAALAFIKPDHGRSSRPTWPLLRDLVHGAVHALPRPNRCAHAVAVWRVDGGVDRDVWFPFATMAIAALDLEVYPRRLPAYTDQLMHGLLRVDNVTLAMQVINRPDFSTIFESFQAKLSLFVTSRHWLEVRDAALAQVAKTPEHIQFYVCTAAAHAAMRAKVEETAWAQVMMMALDAMESVASVQHTTEFTYLWTMALSMTDSRPLVRLVGAYMTDVPVDQVDKDLQFFVEQTTSLSTAHLVPLARLVYAKHAAVVVREVPTAQWAYAHAKFPEHRGVERFLRSDFIGEEFPVPDCRIYSESLERKYEVSVVHRARQVGKVGLVKKRTAAEQAKVERDAALELMRQLEVYYGEEVKLTGADQAMEQ